MMGYFFLAKTRVLLVICIVSCYFLCASYVFHIATKVNIYFQDGTTTIEKSRAYYASSDKHKHTIRTDTSWVSALYPDTTMRNDHQRQGDCVGRIWDVSTALVKNEQRKNRPTTRTTAGRDDGENETKKKTKKKTRQKTPSFAYTGDLAETEIEVDKEGCVPVSRWHQYVPTTCNILHELDMQSGLIQDANAYASTLREEEDDDDDSTEDDANAYASTSQEEEDDDSTDSNNGNGGPFRLKYMFPGAAREAWLLEDANNNNNNDNDSSSSTTSHGLKQSPPLILKTLRWHKEIDPGQVYRQRKDALATERLTFSPHVVDIYGYCSMSVLNEYADGGDFYHGVLNDNSNATSWEKLIYARDAARGLAHIHNLDGPDHVTTMVHHDIRGPNFLLVGGKLKYHDFNQAKMLKWNPKKETKCGFFWDEPCADREIDVYPRAPEECQTPNQKKYLSERVETYRLGCFIFKLLTNEHPYKFEPEGRDRPLTEVLTWVLDKTRIPTLPNEIENSNDPATKVLVHGMRKAMEYDVEERLNSRSLAEGFDVGSELVMMLDAK